jgi:hypothetical protein
MIQKAVGDDIPLHVWYQHDLFNSVGLHVVATGRVLIAVIVHC